MQVVVIDVDDDKVKVEDAKEFVNNEDLYKKIFDSLSELDKLAGNDERFRLLIESIKYLVEIQHASLYASGEKPPDLPYGGISSDKQL